MVYRGLFEPRCKRAVYTYNVYIIVLGLVWSGIFVLFIVLCVTGWR